MSFGDATGYPPAASERTVPLPEDWEKPAADRMGVHIVLEALLAGGFITVLFLLYRSADTPLGHAAGRADVVVWVLPLLVLTMAIAMAMRVGVVNLAAAVIGLGAARLFADTLELGALLAAVIAVAAGAAAGLALAALVLVLRVPGWLGSAVLAVGGWTWITARGPVESLGHLDSSRAWIWLVCAMALSILGGVIGAFGNMRAALSRCRAAAADIVPRGGGTVLMTVGALAGSGASAGLAGVWMTWAGLPSSNLPLTSGEPLPLTVFALGAVLLGGTSVYGRRGGVLGTLLAVLCLATAVLWVALHGWFDVMWIAFAAVCVGIVVNRVVEAWGKPAESHDAEDDTEYPPAQQEYVPGDIDPYRGVDRLANYGP